MKKLLQTKLMYPMFLPIETIIGFLQYLIECSFIVDDEECLLANLAQLMYAYELQEAEIELRKGGINGN